MRLTPPTCPADCATLELPISKSLMARRLLLLEPDELPYSLPQDYPEDIHALTKALGDLHAGARTIDVHESGTAMRFMAAYIAATASRVDEPIRLQGAGRQHERPIAPLVDALRALGGRVRYLQEEGFPPLEITPSLLSGRRIPLNASSSSQYLSALMLIAPLIEAAECYEIDTSACSIASLPYAQMTQRCMAGWGYSWAERDGVFAYLGQGKPTARELIEADWTAASYAYLWVALGAVRAVRLPRLCLPSLQGDSLHLPTLFERLGVDTVAEDRAVVLRATATPTEAIYADCRACPDIVPTIVAACLALGVAFRLEGVSHLRIKESDRLEALRLETGKLGFILSLEGSAISWSPQDVTPPSASNICLEPHGDHRMAMSLAPLFVHRLGSASVLHPEVVGKSFPTYWQVLSSLGYNIEP